MGVCTSKSTAVLSPNRSDTFINPTPVTFKRRGSGTNETDKEATAVTIQTESYEQRGGAARDDANSTGDRSINHATDGNKEGHEERNSSNERKPDTGRKAESTSLSSLTRDDANSTVRKDEGNIIIEEHESTKDNDYEDPEDRPGSKQKREPEKKSNKKLNLIGNVTKFIQRSKTKSKKKRLESTKRLENIQVLVGNMEVDVPKQSRIVRIFISSTFTDTENERNILMTKAYPKLKTFCEKLGYEFQVVDMRWGVHDTATDSHTGTELCQKEIKLCQNLSTGPNFVSLVSHKYGYRMPPRTIESTIFEQIMSEIKKKENKDAIEMFQKWYRKDDNAVPSEYVFANITSHFSDYLSSEIDKKKNQSRSEYNKECEVMISALEETVAGIEYSKSVTEEETKCGLLEVKDACEHCVWFQRTIKEIEVQERSDILSKYIESGEDKSKRERSRKLLAEMKEKMTSKLLVDGKIKTYTVGWDKRVGINPEDKEHDSYLQKLADEFVTVLSSMIKDADEKRLPSDPVVEEVHRHIQFCKEKHTTFYGRDDCLRKIKEYVTGQSGEAMVVYGVSGCGKTSLMAEGAYLARQWTDPKAAVIIRFIGTSQRSTTINDLLQSLSHQIKLIYGANVTFAQDIQKDFTKSIELASKAMPLILILDSLDQLNTPNNDKELEWLKNKLPNGCKIILSTLQDEKYYPILKKSIQDENNFLEVTTIPENDVRKVIEKWLNLRNRTLTAIQMDRVLKAFTKCSLPLFLKLSFEEAMSWNSFSDEKETVLKDTVDGSIEALFKKLEGNHGTKLVTRSLGYLTVSQNGLTEAELEDVLSCDDDVLTDIYKFWTPPIRRLPPLLLVRLKTDLEHYLVERDADGSRVFYWYHRQFKETAEKRYCSKKEERGLLHTGLADFFSGVWANGHPKNDKGKDEAEDGDEGRFVSSQPFKKNNLRKLNNLPFHLIKAGKRGKLKKECLCNFMFLLMKLRATSLWSVIEDFASAELEFPEDKTIKMIHDALQLSQRSLLYDPNQLPVQMIRRLENILTKDKYDFIPQCKKSSIPYLLPDKDVLLTPGYQLVRSMAGENENSIIYIDVSKDGRHTVTCGDECVCLWNNVKGKQEHSIKTKGVQKAYFCRGDAFLLICTEDKIVVKDRSGKEDFSVILDAMSWCLCGRRRESLVLFKDNQATMYNLVTRKPMNPVQCEEVSFTSDSTQSFKGNSFLGSKTYAVAFSIQKTTLCLFDISQQQFVWYHNVCRDSSIQKDDVDSMQWAITHNETCIAYTCSRSGYIRFVDIETERTLVELHVPTVFKEEYIGEILDLQISRDKRYLTFIRAGLNDKNTLVAYSFVENELLERKFLNTSVTHASSSNGTTVVTSSKEASIQVWDLTRPKELQNTNTTTKDYKYLQCMPNSRYVLGTYSEGSENKIWTLFVYDVRERTYVRRILFPTDVDVQLTGNNTVIVWPLIEDSKTAFLVDLKTMSTEEKLNIPQTKQYHVNGNGEGFLQCIGDPEQSKDFLTVDGNSIPVVLSRGCGNTAFNIWNKETQKPVASFKSDDKIDKLKIMDGRYIIGIDKNQGIVKWELVTGSGDGPDKADSYPEDFPNKVTVYCHVHGIDVNKKEEGTIVDDKGKEKEEQIDDSDQIKRDTDDDEGKEEDEQGDDSDQVKRDADDDEEKEEEEQIDDSDQVKKDADDDEGKEEEEQDDDSDQVKRDTDDDEGKEEEDFYSSDDDFYQAMMDADDLGYDFYQAMMETDDDDEETEEEDSNSSGDDVSQPYMDSEDDDETEEDSFLRMLHQMNSMLNLPFRI